ATFAAVSHNNRAVFGTGHLDCACRWPSRAAAAEHNSVDGKMNGLRASIGPRRQKYRSAELVLQRHGPDRVDGLLAGGRIVRAAGWLHGPFDGHIRQGDAAAHVAGAGEVHNQVAASRRLIDKFSVCANMDPTAFRRERTRSGKEKAETDNPE